MADEATAQAASGNKIDLDSLDVTMIAEKVELNPDANPMEAPPPVTDGVHRVKLFFQDGLDELLETKANAKTGEKRTYMKANFYGVVIAEGTRDNNKRVFGKVNTLSFDGKSEMAYIILQAMGGKDNPEAKRYFESLDNYGKVAKAFKALLAGNPIIKIKTKWVARYNAGTKDEPDWKTHLSGMTQFPQNPDGTYRNVVPVKGAGEVSAIAEIQDYFPDK